MPLGNLQGEIRNDDPLISIRLGVADRDLLQGDGVLQRSHVKEIAQCWVNFGLPTNSFDRYPNTGRGGIFIHVGTSHR